jgi:hypothetical protein
MKTHLCLFFGSILVLAGISSAFVTLFVKAINDNGVNVFLSVSMGLGGIIMLLFVYNQKESSGD